MIVEISYSFNKNQEKIILQGQMLPIQKNFQVLMTISNYKTLPKNLHNLLQFFYLHQPDMSVLISGKFILSQINDS